jgi:hypothetical protein
MARVTEAEVREIIEVDAALVLTPFITIANLLVTTHLAAEISDTDLLKEIERWLAAHFVAVRDPRATSESIDSVSRSFEQMKMGEGLMGTRYGQQAALLDTSGKLQNLTLKKATFHGIDTYVEPGSQSDYV